MLPGISGSLIGSAYLESVLIDELAARVSNTNVVRRLHQWWRRVERSLGPASSARSIADSAALPLIDLLGFRLLHLEPHGGGFVGTLSRGGGDRVVLCTTAWSGDPDRAWRDTVRAGRTAHARWGLIYTGPRLRIVDAARTWSRRALDFDLAAVASHEQSAIALVGLVAAPESHSEHPSLDQLIEQCDAHGVKVCAALGDGVLGALTDLVAALETPGRGRQPLAEFLVFEQAVTIVYRLLFLLFAESRAMVPTWHHVYRDSYTVEALCRRAAERRAPPGLWAALQAISRLAHAGCRAGDLIVTPFNGRLFSPRHTPLAERARVPDAVVARTVMALATGAGPNGRHRIAYADLGVEQLGAVYERVLEYEPTRHAGRLTLTRTSHDRKSTGSFYTPRAMTEFLVRRALHPLTDGRSADDILALRVVDPAMGSGAFLVAACRYLARAVERALIEEGRLPPDCTPAERAAIRQTVAQRCLFGVDVNPMAVQLTRLSLWLTTLSRERPLTFLDHHLACGDSLVGASLADLARYPVTHPQPARGPREPSLPLFPSEAADHLAVRVLPERFRIACEPGTTPDEVRAKERALADLSAPGAPLAQWKAAADLWCAAWFWSDRRLTPGIYADLLGSLIGGQAALPPHQRADLEARARQSAARHRFFHWELEFPEVFFGPDGRRRADGGFDAVIGNPPWDVLRADTGDSAARDRSRDEQLALLRFVRDAKAYRHQGRGHANRYQLFLERALQLTRPGGRLALVLPSGVATDHGSAALRHHLFDSVAVDRLIGFDNREAIFPIHRDVRFLLLTGTTNARTERLTCVFGRSQAAWLDELPDAATDDPPDARPIVLSRSLLTKWDPDRLALPLLSGPRDLEILAGVSASVPRLGDPTGWHARFGRELNATDDRPHFVPLNEDRTAALLTIVEGKHLEPFRVSLTTSRMGITPDRAATLLPPEQTFRRVRLAYRDVASSTNRLTLIAALLPAGTVSTHTLFCLKTPLGEQAQYCLLALLNSLVTNYLVRLQVTTHVTTALMARLPVPRPPSSSSVFRELAALARSLERTGIASQEPAYARLNSIAASLYGLTPQQYEHVLGTFPLLPKALRDECLGVHVRATETQ